jgi:uncharacterized protein
MRNTFLLCLLLLATTSFAQYGAKSFIDFPYIEVNGKAEKEITPDEIYLNIQINESDSKGKLTVEQQEKEMLKKLKDLKINIEKQLSVKDFSSNFQKYLLKKTQIQTSKEYQLLVHDGATVARVFMALESIGISNISIERVDHSEMERFRREVKIEAIKAAKEKAEQLSIAIGQSIGKAIYIQEIETYNPRMLQSNVAGIAMRKSFDMAMEEVPNIEFEKIFIEYTVHTKFELK